MPRPPRIQIPGLVRHVMSRGNAQMRIFLDDVDYRQFIYVLGDVVEECEIECWNYCVMPNHYHATLKPTRPNLSEAIRRINSVYAQWWNKRHERVGHVFQGRFKDQIVETTEYLLTLSRYVVMNPVRARLVEHPKDWPWSSYRATVGQIPCPSFVAVSSTLRLFGEDGSSGQGRFTQFVTAAPNDEAIVERIRSNERVLGTAAFKAGLKAARELRSEPLMQM
jgi:REP-associated tyrosine transposase